MKIKRTKEENRLSFACFLNSMHPICGRCFRITLLITLIELLITVTYAYFELNSGYLPLFAVYIPILEQIFIFLTISVFLIFLTDSLARTVER